MAFGFEIDGLREARVKYVRTFALIHKMWGY